MVWIEIVALLGLFADVSFGQTKEERLANQRLPGDLRPYHYYVELQADIYNETRTNHSFTGIVEISFECINNTNDIYLNVKGYQPDGSSISISLAPENAVPAPVPVLSGTTWEEENEFYIIVLDDDLVPGAKYRVRMTFERGLNQNGRGFYQLSYESNFETRWMAATQFEASDARSAFPCFDEPEYKATFDIVLLRTLEYRTLSNMHMMRSDPRPNDWIADVYARTPVMSTYTLAFVVCDFQYRERVSSRGVASRIWARPDQLDLTDRALTVAVEVLDWYEQFTGINFPLQKLDHIAIPKAGNAGGAMENWGLVTYGEPALLFHEEESDINNLIRIYSVMSHEIAHMWFGNLVTCAWWSEIWLNEGFATYFNLMPYESLLGWPVSELQATYTLPPAFRADQDPASPPIRQEIDTPQNTRGAFGAITYRKGGSFLRMLKSALGSDTFMRGLQRYLNRHQYSTATTEDLWTALQEQVDADGVTEPDGQTRLMVKDKFDPWVRQAGFPLVHFDRATPFGILARLNQTRFTMFMDSEIKEPSPWNYQWWVPITVYHDDQPDKTTDTQFYLPPGTGLEVTRGLPPPSKYLIANVDQVGFYRLVYDNATQEQLRGILDARNTDIPTMNRAALLDDMFRRVRAYHQPETESLEFTRYMANENELLPWRVAVEHIGYHEIMFQREAHYGDHERYWRSKIDPVYNRNRFVPPDVIMRRMLRQLATFWSCSYNNADCIQTAMAAFENWWRNPGTQPIEADQQMAYMCAAVWAGELFEWETVYALYMAFGSYRTEQRYLTALACSRDYYLLERYMVAMEEGDLPSSGAAYLGLTVIGQEIVWRHLREQWTNSSLGNNKYAALVAQAMPRNRQEELEEFEDFMQLYPPMNENEERVFNFTRALIDNNIRWMSVNEESIAQWLKDNLPSSGPGDESPGKFSSGAGGGLMTLALNMRLEELHEQQDIGQIHADMTANDLFIKAVQDLFPYVRF